MHTVHPAVGGKVLFQKNGTTFDAVIIRVAIDGSSTVTLEVRGGPLDGLQKKAVYDAAGRCDESWRYPGK